MLIHGRLAIKWRACDIGEAKEALENELWHSWSNGRGWGMDSDVGKATEGLENEFWLKWSNGKVGAQLILQPFRHNSFSNPSVALPTSQLILQCFHRFTYVTTHSPTLPLHDLRYGSFSNPSFASPTSKAVHIRHLASHPWFFHPLNRKLHHRMWFMSK